MLNGLDLFSGIGGITLALDQWVRPIAYCENDRYAQGVLLSRMSDGTLPVAPIWDDVRSLTRGNIPDEIDIITGGFPCQDISSAGRGAGLDGKRSGLFFEIIRLTRELRPRFVFLENVPAITVRGLDRVLLEFTALGYDCRWTIVSAAELGACHRRERWFMLAYADSDIIRDESIRITAINETRKPKYHGGEGSNPNSNGERLEGIGRKSELPRPSVYNGWKSEPTIRRGNNGISHRVDRLRGLGNAVVPAAAREAFERLGGLK